MARGAESTFCLLSASGSLITPRQTEASAFRPRFRSYYFFNPAQGRVGEAVVYRKKK